MDVEHLSRQSAAIDNLQTTELSLPGQAKVTYQMHKHYNVTLAALCSDRQTYKQTNEASWHKLTWNTDIIAIWINIMVS